MSATTRPAYRMIADFRDRLQTRMPAAMRAANPHKIAASSPNIRKKPSVSSPVATGSAATDETTASAEGTGRIHSIQAARTGLV
jgi:hypothetical protein